MSDKSPKKVVAKKAAFQKPAPVSYGRPTPAQQKLFFDHLAETCNVSASARVAGIASKAIYSERTRSPKFFESWDKALAEGYVRLETYLLSEALIPANGNVSEATLKSRAQKYAIGMKLLAAHAARVRGIEKPALTFKSRRVGTSKDRVTAKLNAMRARMKPGNDNDGGSENGEAA